MKLLLNHVFALKNSSIARAYQRSAFELATEQKSQA